MQTILGAGGTSQIGTLVERTTRFTILLHLPTTRTGEDLRAAISEAIGKLPAHLKRSITWAARCAPRTPTSPWITT